MKFKVDMPELEKQRYEAIKKSGKYLELDILIGAEKEKMGEHEGRMPVVTTEMHHCGAEEIGCLYLLLNNLSDQLEKRYPEECLLAKLGMGITCSEISEEVIKEKEEDNSEDDPI